MNGVDTQGRLRITDVTFCLQAGITDQKGLHLTFCFSIVQPLFEKELNFIFWQYCQKILVLKQDMSS